MMKRTVLFQIVTRTVIGAAALSVAACSLDKQEMPALSGPSTFGVSVTMAASPDRLPRDGSSQSVVTLTVRDAQGKGMAGQHVTLALPSNAPTGAALSQSEVTTGANGQATFAVTAPVAGSLGNITVGATPVGTDAANRTAQYISILAIPSNAGAPVFSAPPFTLSPTSPEVGQVVTFDASSTTDEGFPCTTCTFAWDFGGDGTGTGRIVTHTFTIGGTYLVTVTATDAAGSTSFAQRAVTITTLTIPTSVSVTSSPATPIAGQAATFTATATPTANHRIVSYQFVWGDGSSDTTASPIIQHTYTSGGSFLLTLTVKDDQGQTTTINKVLSVSSGLVASFTFTKVVNDVTFDASASSSSVASTIVDYAWDFDSDGSYDATGASAVVTHTFVPGTYRVTLKVTDDRGTSQTSSQTVTVP